MRSSAGRVVDLFRSWDANGDGNVSRKEFHKAMKVLGYDVGKKAIDQLFDEWDGDGGGELGLKELQRILSKSSPKLKKTGRAALVVGKVGATSKNPSPPPSGGSGARSPSPGGSVDSFRGGAPTQGGESLRGGESYTSISNGSSRKQPSPTGSNK